MARPLPANKTGADRAAKADHHHLSPRQALVQTVFPMRDLGRFGLDFKPGLGRLGRRQRDGPPLVMRRRIWRGA